MARETAESPSRSPGPEEPTLPSGVSPLHNVKFTLRVFPACTKTLNMLSRLILKSWVQATLVLLHQSPESPEIEAHGHHIQFLAAILTGFWLVGVYPWLASGKWSPLSDPGHFCGYTDLM